MYVCVSNIDQNLVCPTLVNVLSKKNVGGGGVREKLNQQQSANVEYSLVCGT